jgi:tRNA-2-methylthio-N6-dimethylallyladenosine synthase
MYDQNPTLEGIKNIDETRQGQVFYKEQTGETVGAKRFYIESYGCQMNFSDSEIVASILADTGYVPTRDVEESDLILINTCSIREKAEDTVRKRLKVFESFKKSRPSLVVGVLGCMAERLKAKFLDEEKLVDLVVGPDAYRSLPELLGGAQEGNRMVNVLLSREETYADIAPVRLDTNSVTAFISIMRGCDNMCSFCVVPFTRGRERSRDPFSIVSEAVDLYQKGYRDITLLGQNVDSYKWENPEDQSLVNFAQLLRMTAEVHPDLRIRFSTSHPKDITNEVLQTIADVKNICKYIHLPVQSGNTRVLEIMNRTYTADWYRERVQAIRSIIPDCAISSDIIAGFCTETEEEHTDTLEMMAFSQYTMSFMFAYSERPGTLAARKYPDDIPLEVKKRRLAEIIRLQNSISLELNKADIGKVYEVLIEGNSKKSESDWCGRNSQNKMLVFPKVGDLAKGQYVNVKVLDATGATLLGVMVDDEV